MYEYYKNMYEQYKDVPVEQLSEESQKEFEDA